MTICKHLDISTVHLTEEDNDILSNFCTDISYGEHDYGFYVSVPDVDYESPDDGTLHAKINQALEDGLSESFVNILKYAHKNDCSIVVFDRDGEVDENLPTFDWWG